ncbi:MAG: nodulation S family protein [Mesorhizobium sp.]|nr:nodulation S family protein [Mesorhizobium sp.]
MPRAVIDPAGFEAKFQENIDPWNYATSPFEAYKRRILLRACGTRVYGRTLELACATGDTTLALLPKSLRLLAQDSAPTAIEETRRRLGGNPKVSILLGRLPQETPRGPFDLIVASEIFYYLPPNDLRLLLMRICPALAPGGRLVILHHLKDFDDAAIRPRLAQAQAFAAVRPPMRLAYLHQTDRFQAAAFDKGIR